MFESTERIIRRAVSPVLAEYGLNWSFKDIIEDGGDNAFVRFETSSLAINLQEVVKREGQVTPDGVAEELRKSLEQLGYARPAK